jgi:hypothetical protein
VEESLARHLSSVIFSIGVVITIPVFQTSGPSAVQPALSGVEASSPSSLPTKFNKDSRFDIAVTSLGNESEEDGNESKFHLF